MIRMLQLTCVCVIVGASTAYSQEAAPTPPANAPDSAALTAVSTYAMKSGKIALSSGANPKPTFLPDGTYTNESGTIVVILDGVIARLQRESGEITEISSVRMNRERVIMLTPSTNALMQVSDMRLPSGTFKSADGLSSISVVMGRPTAFSVPGVSPEH